MFSLAKATLLPQHTKCYESLLTDFFYSDQSFFSKNHLLKSTSQYPPFLLSHPTGTHSLACTCAHCLTHAHILLHIIMCIHTYTDMYTHTCSGAMGISIPCCSEFLKLPTRESSTHHQNHTCRGCFFFVTICEQMHGYINCRFVHPYCTQVTWKYMH